MLRKNTCVLRYGKKSTPCLTKRTAASPKRACQEIPCGVTGLLHRGCQDNRPGRHGKKSKVVRQTAPKHIIPDTIRGFFFKSIR